MNRPFFLTAFLAAALSSGAGTSTNLIREPGTRLTADSFFTVHVPSKAGDGNFNDKTSRWVSTADGREHWLAAEFSAPREVNRIALHFWTDGHLATDFDVQAKFNNEWKTVREVRGNRERVVRAVFPTIRTETLRILFRRQIPDNMVRLYEFTADRMEQPVAVTLSAAFHGGLLLPGRRPELLLDHCEPEKTIQLPVSIRLLDEHGKVLKTRRQACVVRQRAAVPLPLPDEYGSYSYEINLLDTPVPAVYFAPAPSVYRSSSPFGAHYHSSDPAFAHHAGIWWWRNHDVYGRWNFYLSSAGKTDWSDYEERLEFVRRNQLRECSVYLGAPRQYSTILPGEPVTGDLDWLYSYYPPADLDAWRRLYLTPMAEKIKQASPFRAHEVWNEAWSYYRLSGPHGTAGEAAALFRSSYETLKRVDPEALVYATDVKPEATENPYAYRNFGRDLFDLGFLRYTDLLSYHSYGIMSYPRLEQLRRNLWAYGRDYDLWSTETAVEGKPFPALLESLAAHRAAGNGKTFLYTGDKWAPLRLDGKPTLYLVAQAALCRTLGDALPLGFFTADGIRVFVFANGGTAAAVLCTDSAEPVRVDRLLSEGSSQEDIYGRRFRHDLPLLTRDNPLIAIRPPDALVRRALAERLAFHGTERGGEMLPPVANRMKTADDTTWDTLLDHEIAALRRMRRQAADQQLYTTGKALDLLVNARIMLDRRAGNTVNSGTTRAALRDALAAQWREITRRTGNDGILPDTERLTSRAQKELQFAAMYDSDGDAAARERFLESAAEALANGRSRLAGEAVAHVYKTKSAFRSAKRLIRSERYCFPNGRPQEAVITLANPFGRELTGTLAVTPPDGWQADRTQLAYRVPPMSRQLLKLRLTAPETFAPGKIHRLTATDQAGQFPALEAECEIVRQVPSHPILGGSLSTGEFTGN